MQLLSPSTWTMRWRLFLAFKVVLTLVLILSISIWWINREQTPALPASAATTLSDDAAAAILRAATSLRGYLLTGDAAQLSQYQADVEAYTIALAEISRDPNRPDTAPLWAQVGVILATERTEFDQPSIVLRQAVTAGTEDPAALDAFVAIATAAERQARLFGVLTTIDQLDDAHYARLETDDIARARQLQLVVIIGAAIIIVGGLALTTLIIRSISVPVERLARAANEIAAGRLDRRVGITGGDEVGQMATAFDAMADQLEQQMAAQAAALAASRQQEVTLRTVIERVGVGVMLVDQHDRLVVANAAAAQLVGVPRPELRGGEPMADITAHFPAAIQTAMTGLAKLEARHVAAPPMVVLQPERAGLAIELSIASIGNHDQPRFAYLWVLRDITHDHTVSEMKTEFVSMVAHELRTPLTSIKGYVDLLLDDEVGALSGEQRDFLGIVAQSTDRLVSLINDVLDVSRIEAGQIVLTTAPVDLRAVLSSVGDALRPLMDAKHQSFTLSLPAATPLVVAGDADRLAQVFTNLLSNAHKYAPAGTAIEIRGAVEGGAIVVSVIDQGIGLTPEEQEQLFTRFFRAANPTVQTVGGTGLGLAITRSLVELHGGTISVSSRPGHGATFSVRLPRLPRLAAPPLGMTASGDDHPNGIEAMSMAQPSPSLR